MTVFGESFVCGGVTYDCVVHLLSRTTLVVQGRPGITEEVDGIILITPATWAAMGGRKGVVLTIGNKAFRVANDPDVGPESATVELRLRAQ